MYTGIIMVTISTALMYILSFLGIYFQFFLLLTYLGWRKHHDPLPGFTDEQLPTVSIMVPCWNEETTVIGTLESLLASNYPADKLTLIVIDDGSTDTTWTVLQAYAYHPQVKLFHKVNEGSKFAALNFGLQHVTTSIVGCLDADSAVHPDAIRSSVEWFSDTGVYAVVPSMVIQNPQSIMQYMQKVEYEMSTYLKNVLHQLEALYVAPGPLTLFRKTVFDKLGPYKEAHHTEDLEIALRMQINNMRMVHADRSLVYTKGPRTWPDLLKQRIRWTYGFIKNVQDYKRYMFTRELGDLSFFILPFSAVSLIFVMFIFGMLSYQLISGIITTVQHTLLVGFHWYNFSLPQFSIFSLPSIPYSYIGLLGLALVIYTLVISRRVMLRQKLLSFDLLTILFYPYFASWWTIRSLYNAVRSQKSSWR